MSVFKHIVHFAFSLALFAGCQQTKLIAPVADSQIAYISMVNTQVIYRGLSGMFEFGSENFVNCHTYIDAEGGQIVLLESNIVGVKPDPLSDQVILKLMCVKPGDTTVLLSKKYPVVDLPLPQIYYGGINLSDYTIYNDTITFNPAGIEASYAHIPGLTHLNATIVNCSYTFRGEDYRLNGIKKTFQTAILHDIKLGEKIQFNYVKMSTANGEAVTLYLKREITKASAIDDNVFILR